MEKEFTCFFTGHRAIAKNQITALTARLEGEIQSLINDKGVTDFITGGALGFDTLAARTIIRLKKKNDFIKLHLYLPCYNQMANWPARAQYEGRMIMSFADTKTYTTEGNYTDGCMQLRNRRMAEDSDWCIAYMLHPRSGTAYTVAYADKIGDNIINLADME